MVEGVDVTSDTPTAEGSADDGKRSEAQRNEVDRSVRGYPLNRGVGSEGG